MPQENISSLADIVTLLIALGGLVVAIAGWVLQRRDQQLKWAEFHAKYESTEAQIGQYVKGMGKPKRSAAMEDQEDTELASCRGGPYIVGPHVNSPEDFYGRRELLERFFERTLLGKAVVSVSILGARRAGKTSFLRHVSHPKVRACYLAQHESDTVVAYVDLLGVASPTDFYTAVLDAIDQAVQTMGRQVPLLTLSGDFGNIKRLFETASAQGWRFLILLDEFEQISETERFDQTFFDRLHALGSLPNVGLVVSAYRDPFSVGIDPSQNTSPLFNIFHGGFYVDAFSLEEARELVRKPAANAGKAFTADDVDYVVGITGRLPFALQAGGWALYQAHHESITGNEAHTFARRIFVDFMANHFLHQWNHFTEEERLALSILARGHQPNARTNEKVLSELARYGFIEDLEGTYRILGSVFGEWIASQ